MGFLEWDSAEVDACHDSVEVSERGQRRTCMSAVIVCIEIRELEIGGQG
jgi:hypothetical protein